MSIDLRKLQYNGCMEQEFKFWLREFRRKNDLTQERLGGQIGVAHVTIGQWERGEKPDPGRLLKLAEFSGEDPHYLFNLVYGLPLPDEDREREAEVEAILRKIAAMPPKQREQAEKYIDFLLQEARKNADVEAGE